MTTVWRFLIILFFIATADCLTAGTTDRDTPLSGQILSEPVEFRPVTPADSARCMRVYFPRAVRYIHLEFSNNKLVLDSIVRLIEEARSAGTLDRVSIRAGASPEGNTDYNARLALNRAKEIRSYLSEATGLQDKDFILNAVGIDWQGLADLLRLSSKPYRDRALDIVLNTPEWITTDGVVTDGRKRRLQNLDGGRAWNDMFEDLFPTLRSGCTVYIITKPSTGEKAAKPSDADRSPSPVAPPDNSKKEDVTNTPVRVNTPKGADNTNIDTPIDPSTNDNAAHQKPIDAHDVDAVTLPLVPLVPATASESSPRYFDLYTNLLYDALAIPNIGVDIYLGNHVTVGGSWMYAWWSDATRFRYWRIYGGELNARLWWGSAKPLTGHHLGLAGGIYTFDFQWGGRGHMGGIPGGTLWDRFNYAASLEYGYTLPLTRRLNLDFSISAGYVGGEYREYIPVDGHEVWLVTKNRHYIGPTRLGISLVWLLGRDNINSKKGGGL